MGIDLENAKFNQTLSDLTNLGDIPRLLSYVTSHADVNDLLRLTGRAKKSGGSDSEISAGGRSEDNDAPSDNRKQRYFRDFKTRRAFCEAVGIGESTLASWLKEKHLPPQAKAIIGLLYLYLWSVRDYELLDEERMEKSNIVVDDGDTFMIVEYKANYNRSPGSGRIEARGIPDRDTAYRYAQHIELRHWLKDYAKSIEKSDGELANHLNQVVDRNDERTTYEPNHLKSVHTRKGKRYFKPIGECIERDGWRYSQLDEGNFCEVITKFGGDGKETKYYRPNGAYIEQDGRKYYLLDYNNPTCNSGDDK